MMMKPSILIFTALTMISFSAFSASPELMTDCSVLNQALGKLDPDDIAKCNDLAAQKAPLFEAEGRGQNIAACLTGSSRAKAKGFNACSAYAVESGLDPSDCTLLTNFKTSETYGCRYTAVYYMKGSSDAFIGFTLDSETQAKLFREAKSRNTSVRKLIREKLQR